MGRRYRENEQGYSAPLRIAAVYFVAGMLWIVFSDRVLLMLTGLPEQFTFFQTVKGGLYVLVTAILAYVLMRRFAVRQLAIRDQLRERELLLEQRLRERDALIREISHRVKNNLQMMLGIVNLSSRGIDDEMALARLHRIRERVHAIAMVHESIFAAENLEVLYCDRFLYAVVRHVTETRAHHGVSLNTSMEECQLTIEMALPCGLIVSELLGNALEHAFPGKEEGTIDVIVQRNHRGERNEALVIVIRDDGIDYSSSDQSNTPVHAVGIILADAMAQQVGGTLRIDRRSDGISGTEATLVVPFRPEGR